MLTKKQKILCIFGSLILFIIIIILIIVIFNHLKNLSEKYNYPDGKKMAYISTWDDTQNIESYIRIDKLCKEMNLAIPLTLNVSSAPTDQYGIDLTQDVINKYKVLLNEPIGHTVESHSVSHPRDSENPEEYTQSQKTLKRIFGNQYAKTYCFPYGKDPLKQSTIDIVKKHYIAARDIDRGYFNSNQLYSLHCFPIEEITESDIKTAIDGNKTLITYGHGITEIGGWNPISEKDFIKHLKILKKYESDIWFVTLPKFIEYLRDTNQL